MPVCGFNQEMLEGMNSLHEGLVENVVDGSFVDSMEESPKEQ